MKLYHYNVVVNNGKDTDKYFISGDQYKRMGEKKELGKNDDVGGGLLLYYDKLDSDMLDLYYADYTKPKVVIEYTVDVALLGKYDNFIYDITTEKLQEIDNSDDLDKLDKYVLDNKLKSRGIKDFLEASKKLVGTIKISTKFDLTFPDVYIRPQYSLLPYSSKKILKGIAQESLPPLMTKW